MIFNQHRRAIGALPSYETAIIAFDSLILSGFPPAKVFLAGKDLVGKMPQDKAASICGLEDAAGAGTITGTTMGLTNGIVSGNVLGGVTGLLLGLGILALPGIGQVMLTSAIIFTLTSSSICMAAGGLMGALIGLGMTERQARDYSELMSRGDYLIIVNGTEDEIHRAESILNAHKIRKILKFFKDA